MRELAEAAKSGLLAPAAMGTIASRYDFHAV